MKNLTKKEILTCESFINKLAEYCKKQEDFYYLIAQNGDHSEDFIFRMTDMAMAFHSVSQYLEICANSVLTELQSEPLGDPVSTGQVEQTAPQNTSPNSSDV